MARSTQYPVCQLARTDQNKLAFMFTAACCCSGYGHVTVDLLKDTIGSVEQFYQKTCSIYLRFQDCRSYSFRIQIKGYSLLKYNLLGNSMVCQCPKNEEQKTILRKKNRLYQENLAFLIKLYCMLLLFFWCVFFFNTEKYELSALI